MVSRRFTVRSFMGPVAGACGRAAMGGLLVAAGWLVGPSLSRPLSAQEGSLQSLGTRTQGIDWPRFLGPTYDGKSPETGIRTDWSDGKLPVRWSRPLGTSYGIGSVAAGRYLQFDRVGNAERLTCYQAETGEPLWSDEQPVFYQDMYGYNNGPRSSPTIVDGEVYTMGVAGRLTSRRLRDGRLNWTVDPTEQYGVIQNFFGVGCSPLVWEDLVIVMVGGSPPEDQAIGLGRLDRVSPNGSGLVAFDRATGKERWRVGKQLASYSSPRPAMLDGQPAILIFARGGLLAVDPREGRELWTYPWRADRLESVNAAVPLVAGDKVLISECYDIGSSLLKMGRDDYELLRRDPENRRQQSLRAHWATPIAVDGYVYGCSGRNAPDSDLRCLDLASGEVAWEDRRRTRTSLLFVDGHFVVLEEGGLMQLIQATPTGLEVVTEIDLGQPAADRPALQPPLWAAPILSHGLMYVRGENAVVCFEL